MIKKVIMPTLGLGMEEAVIEKWLKREGEAVAKDEPLLVVETEKAATEITAPAEGTLKQILQPDGATVPVTQIIAYIETADSEIVSDLPSATGATEPPAATMEQAGQGGTAPSAHPQSGAPDAPEGPAGEASQLRASPAARRMARELGVDLSLVKGTGPQGRIQGDDVRLHSQSLGRRPAPAQPSLASPTGAAAVSQPPNQHLAAVTPDGLPGRLVSLGRKRRITAERMALSARTVARITLNMDVDAGQLMAVRSRLLPVYQADYGVKLSYNDLMVKVVAVALSAHPYLNARWTDEGIFLVEPINVGVAVAVDDGLVVPVVKGANRKKLVEIAAELSGLLSKAREDRLSLEEMSGGTFTITSLGMFGIDSFTPIVNPPESAILGVGRIVERPVGRDGQMVLRPMMTLSLSIDHRVVDGAPAAQFLQRIQQLLEEPYLLL